MLTVRVTPYGKPGVMYVMADPMRGHPEVPIFRNLETAEHVALFVHPDDEELARDLLAIVQERPRWWQDLRKFERVMAAGIADREVERFRALLDREFPNVVGSGQEG